MSKASGLQKSATGIADFWTTLLGSVPHETAVGVLCERLATTLDIPAWPQLTRRSFRENMYVQYSSGLPRVVLNDEKEKIAIDTSGDLTPDLEKFYERYLSEDVNSFGLTCQYAEGFFSMLDALQSVPGEWAKGQVTGPISFGLTVTDQNLRASLYDDMFVDMIVKNMAMNARWQIQQLQAVRSNIILFVDEPYMASFGSAFISLGRDQVVSMLNEVFAAIHQENALAGVHCCANTDWSVLMSTSADILNLDAYGYMGNLALYPVELRGFLDRGGIIAWGIVPNTSEVFSVTPEQIAQRLLTGMKLLCDKAQARGVAISLADLSKHSLIAPSCGLGSAAVDVAERTITTLVDTALGLKALDLR